MIHMALHEPLYRESVHWRLGKIKYKLASSEYKQDIEQSGNSAIGCL